ncbi:Virulence-associated protein E [Natronincola peptidivorans]|uniref:Virulence-associated protein E n=1 Tax=Natronincola peptidivorans TaxID=426128 RepID=A0A1I0E2X0_9FIRM|nr:virulence-associated E family protein [Natronincola peptidivorans]SET38667.1 Virulence-associated protein E [Natronincola peptidivorans]
MNTKLNTIKIKHDGPLMLATGKSRKEINWKNKELIWSQLVEKLSNTTRTPETAAEYKKSSKTQKDEIKDIGGFVGGSVKNGRRKAENVANRSLITLDLDMVEGTSTDIWDSITMLDDYAIVMYSTHSHTPEKPRLRLVIPLSRPVLGDEYQAIARMIANDIGIDQFDDTTYEPHRLMYWPSTPCDGEYVFKFQDGSWLEPDDVLNRYIDWKDVSYWPESSRQNVRISNLIKKQEDPYEKKGIIGAFCRAYSIQEAIEKFIPDVYEATGKDDRYTYTEGSTVGGVVIYENKFSYSHHGTDPASGILCNTFDLIRIHKFSGQDEEAKHGTPVVKLPSYLAMIDFALNDSDVKKLMADERLAEVKRDFDFGTDWRELLEFNRNGELKNTLTNIVLVLRHDPALRGIFYNELRESLDTDECLPWKRLKGGWNKTDEVSLAGYMDSNYKLYAPGKLKEAVLKVAVERSRHPVKDYLNSLPEWDGVKRIDELLIKYLGADDNEYVRLVTRKTLVAAVARVMKPGIKFDTVLVLNGPQAVGKSTLFSKLGGKFFSDSLSISDMKDKTASEKLQGYWLIEIGELAGIKKVDQETLKSFLSRQDDKYRAAYGYSVEDHPRQCIIVGSTNQEAGFLRDITGGRRFWPVRVPGSKGFKSWDLNDKDIEQIWAEAVKFYKEGEPLILSGKAKQYAEEAQTEALESDEREGLVRDYIDRLLPGNWDDMDLYERRNYLRGDDFSQEITGEVKRDKVCVMEIWCELFGKEPSAMRKIDSYEINAIMRKIDGWEKYTGNKDGRARVSNYGIQRVFVRKE